MDVRTRDKFCDLCGSLAAERTRQAITLEHDCTSLIVEMLQLHYSCNAAVAETPLSRLQ